MAEMATCVDALLMPWAVWLLLQLLAINNAPPVKLPVLRGPPA